MLKRLGYIVKKALPSRNFWMGIMLCFCAVVYRPAEIRANIIGDAIETVGEAVLDTYKAVTSAFYYCPSAKELKERYMTGCFPCQIVKTLIASFMKAADKVYETSKEAGKKLLLLGAMIWLVFWAMQKLSSFANPEPMAMMNELVIFLSKCVVAYCFLTAGTGTLVSYVVNPILGAGADFGVALMLESKTLDVKSDPEPENRYDGPTEIVSERVMNKVLKFSESVSNEVAMNLAMGNALTCFSIKEGLLFSVPGLIDIRIPDIWLWLCGAAIWCAGFMLTLSVCYYLIDIPFKLGFAIIALPVVIGLWPFKLTTGKLKSCIQIVLNSAGTFLFLALSSSYAMRLIDESLNVKEGPKGAEDLTGKDALMYAMEHDNVKYIEEVFEFTGPYFIIILFCYIYAIKLISEVTNKYPSEFFGNGMTAGASPMHHTATAATMWAANKAAAPFKLAGQIVAHQAGKAATTVAKAGINLGGGAAAAAGGLAMRGIGKGVSFAGKSINRFSQKARASIQAENEEIKNSNKSTASKMFQRFNNAIDSGIAGGIGLLGRTMDRAGQMADNTGKKLNQPLLNTVNRVKNAAILSGMDVVDAAGRVAEEAKDDGSIAQQKLDQAYEKLGKQWEKTGKTAAQIVEAGAEVGQYGGKALGALGKVGKDIKESPTTTRFEFAKQTDKLKQQGMQTLQTGAGIIGGAVDDVVGTAGALKSGYKTFKQVKETDGILSATASAAKETTNKVHDQMLKSNVDVIGAVRDAAKSGGKGIATAFSPVTEGIGAFKARHEEGGNIRQSLGTAVKAGFRRVGQNPGIQDIKESTNDLLHTMANEKMATLGLALGSPIVAAAGHLKDNLAEGLQHLHTSDQIKAGAAAFKESRSSGNGIGRSVLQGAAGTFENANLIDAGLDVGRLGLVGVRATVQTLNDTVDSTARVVGKAALLGIDVAKVALSPARVAGKAVLGVGSIGLEASKMVLSPVGSIVSFGEDTLKTLGRLPLTVVAPPAKVVGNVVGHTASAIGHSLSFVDSNLYGAAKTAQTAWEGGKTLGRVVHVGYRHLVNTKVGRGSRKVYHVTGKSLTVARKSLISLPWNMIKAAAGEGEYGQKGVSLAELKKRRAERKQMEAEAKTKAKDAKEKRQRWLEEQERALDERVAGYEREARERERTEDLEKRKWVREQRQKEHESREKQNEIDYQKSLKEKAERRRKEAERRRWAAESKRDDYDNLSREAEDKLAFIEERKNEMEGWIKDAENDLAETIREEEKRREELEEKREELQRKEEEKERSDELLDEARERRERAEQELEEARGKEDADEEIRAEDELAEARRKEDEERFKNESLQEEVRNLEESKERAEQHLDDAYDVRADAEAELAELKRIAEEERARAETILADIQREQEEDRIKAERELEEAREKEERERVRVIDLQGEIQRREDEKRVIDEDLSALRRKEEESRITTDEQQKREDELRRKTDEQKK